MQNVPPLINLPPDLDGRVEELMQRCWESTKRPTAIDIARTLNEIRSQRNWKPLSDISYEPNSHLGTRTFKGIWSEFEGSEVITEADTSHCYFSNAY